MNKKLKAFTLAETLVAMVISAIVISFAYTGYEFVIKNFYRFQSSNEKLRQTLLLKTALTNDISKSEYITFSDSRLIIHMNSLEKITYVSAENVLLRRRSDATDTFRLKIVEIVATNNGNKILTENEFVDDVKIGVELTGDKNNEVLSFHKIYGAEQLIKMDSLLTEPANEWGG